MTDPDKIADLIERSSLGAPEARRLRAQADPARVQRVLDEHTRRMELPPYRWECSATDPCGEWCD